MAALLTLPLAMAGCDTQVDQQTFEADAALPPQSITSTDEQGNVIGTPDADDWRSSPLFPTVSVQPIYPNPVPVDYTATVRLPVNIPFTDAIAGGMLLLAYDPSPPQGRIGVVAEVPPGAVFEFVELNFTLTDLRVALQLADARGLYRLYLQDGTGRLITYGDLRVE